MATVIRKKTDRKKMDEFISASERFFMAVSDNWQKFSIFGVIVLVGVLAFAFTMNARAQKEELLFSKMAGVERTITAENRTAAIQELESLVNEFEGVKGVTYARFALGTQHQMAGNTETGLEVFKQIRTSRPTGLFGELSGLQIAFAMEHAGKFQEAIEEFKAITEGDAHYLKAEAYLGWGRCLESVDNKEGALGAYREFIQKFPGYPGYDYAKYRVRVLGG